ncbi:MAG: class SAM-dependent methyltransferase, partial [Hyphomicrobiales bacterium]|nr:class SAM-dependent methyltransferase [Hyphomicrobiales bacterium]
MTSLDLLQKLEARVCPVCGSGPDKATLFLKQSVDAARLDAFSYASRKTPEYMSFNLVTCRECQTIYASPAPPPQAVAQAYHEADYDSSEEAVLAARTYATALARDLATLSARGDALEIGTGTGVFLSELKAAGFARVTGVEPSPKAIAAADPAIRPNIREGIFVEQDFAPESFDLICCFMTLEHVPDPRPMVEACARLLRSGGLLAMVTHDYKGPVNRLLGRRS